MNRPSMYLAPRDAAHALNVNTATLRDWVRRGILERTGPKDRPYHVQHLLAAKDAPKPRRERV